VRPTRPQLLVLAVVAAGAALRFATLDVQSFWIDEGYTVRLLRMDLSGLLHGIPRTEETPPLYYVVAWLWTRAFGTGEVGVRSLSALLGAATIPVAYLFGRRLLSHRAGITAAALAAFNPLLVWYSQEARAYSLLVLLAAASMLLAIEAGDRGGRALPGWAAVSALALATHYFALFVVVPEAAWLLLRAPVRRRAAWAVAGVGAVGAALLPLAVDQAGNRGARFIADTGLGARIAQVPKQFLVGYDSPSEVAFTVAAGVIAAVALTFAWTRTDEPERRGAQVAALLLAASVGVPLLVALAGADYFIARNVIAGWLPFGVLLAAGLAARRARRLGPPLAAAMCAIFLAAVVEVAANPEFQRDDWRAAARALGPPTVPRALVVRPLNGLVPLSLYAPRLRGFRGRGVARVAEVDLLAVAERRAGQTPRPPRPPTPRVPGFRLALRLDRPTFTLIRLRAPAPAAFSLDRLTGLRLAPGAVDVLLQQPRP
jgi:4-amino-4-deoxy-L-arabinose transferase-like glycosyltransferase